MLSPLDDYPVHQVAEPIRHVGTSDRNFYDRYYFNAHRCSGDLMLITGLGQYPNLGVTDAFALLVKDGEHRVVRASRELGADRTDTTVGPFHVEVLEGLRRLRVVLDENEWGLDFDLTWEGAIPAFEEPRHYVRQQGRTLFDSVRLAQTGRWTGRLRVDGETLDVAPDRWWGSRDRSWGVRPVGEAEPPGIHAAKPHPGFFWVYAPMQFPDFSILYICQEQADGTRILEEAVRVWPAGSGRDVEHLGMPHYDLHFVPGTRRVDRAVLSFGGSDLVVSVEVVLPTYLGVGTGYGLDADWRHGMYQGELAVQGLTFDLDDPAFSVAALFGIIDSVARFEVDGVTGWGLFEFGCFGPHRASGFSGWDDTAP